MTKFLPFWRNSTLFFALSTSSLLFSQTTFSQDFSSSTNVSDYVTSPASGTTDKFDGITSSGSGVVWDASANNLKITRTGNGGSFTRLKAFGTTATPTAVSISFDLSTSSAASQTSSGIFYIGNAFTTANSSPSSASSNSRIAVNLTTTDGTFTLRNLAVGNNSSSLSGVQKITWIVNNSGSSLSYNAPDGSTQTVADTKADVWAGTSIIFDEMAATTSGIALNDFKFVMTAGSGSMTFDNIVLAPIASTLAVNNVQKDNTLVYSDHGNVAIVASEKISSVKVYDLNGNLLSTKNPNSKSLNIPISAKIAVVEVEFSNGKKVVKKVKL